MEENKLSYEELVDLMKKISESMKLSEKKQKEIDTKNEKLHKQTKILVVEEGQKELEQLKMDKDEFDEMTTNSLVYSKEQILMIREESEKKYQEMLLKSLEKQKEVDKKLQSMKTRELSDELLEQAEKSAENAKNNIKQELLDYQTKHFEQSAKLDEFEKNIEEYALKLGVEEKIQKVTIPVPTTAPTIEPTTEPTVEPTVEPIMVPTVEPIPEPTIVPTTVPTVEPTVEPTTVPTSAPTTVPTIVPTIQPTTEPTVVPTTAPTITPTTAPTTAPTMETEEEYKIVIGRSGKIFIGDQKYKIPSKKINTGTQLNEKEKLDYILESAKCSDYLSGKSKQEQKEIAKNLDGAVVSSIYAAMTKAKNEDDIEKIDYLMYKYVSSIENVKNGKKSGFTLEYDMKDLAQMGIWGTITQSEVFEEDKLKIRKYARLYERYGIAKQVGEYKRKLFSRILGKLVGEKVLKLPTREDEEVVARTYNQLKDRGIEHRIRQNEFVESLKQDKFYKDADGTRQFAARKIENEEQAQELKELHESQEKQEEDAYYFDKEDDLDGEER